MRRPRPAAQYLRMSTELQQYSLANQATALAAYADRNNFTIVRTYSDAGKSGLDLASRTGLQNLLADVLGGRACFCAILVYDVSRWGRFQDTDEGAHYEFLCKRAGVPVYYCAEEFGTNEAMSARICKGLKRVAAAEYSRELGVKVFNGERRLVTLGFRMGGRAGFGFRRLLLRDGEAIQVLRAGERKAITSDRVKLIPGPSAEVATVRLMFQRACSGQLPSQIAREVNERGIRTLAGVPWRSESVLALLRNRKYTGSNVWATTSQKLRGPPQRTPSDDWIVKDNAFPAIIDKTTFENVQRILQARKPITAPVRKWSNDDLLRSLQGLLAEKGYLSCDLIRSSPGMPSPTTLQQRFGSVRNAFAQIGYTPGTRASLAPSAPPKRFEAEQTPRANSLIPAAQYIRVSTNHQQFSAVNQEAAIATFAAEHGFTVARTYVDSGRSGVTGGKREALNALLRDVLAADTPFGAVLIYDMSRWGRFQDPDEAAHYEYLCRDAGVPVHYCAEPFSPSNALENSVLKVVKRSMAGEYSRELGCKVYEGQRRLATLGFRMGASPGYALRRLLISKDGSARGFLRHGERKSIQSDRVVLVPGPKEELFQLRRIFRMFVRGGGKRGPAAIAGKLNDEGILGPEGKRWSRDIVRELLSSRKYIGEAVWAADTQRLGSRRVPNAENLRIKARASYGSLVSPEIFFKAQNLLELYFRWLGHDLISKLQSLFPGRISAFRFPEKKRITLRIDGAEDVCLLVCKLEGRSERAPRWCVYYNLVANTPTLLAARSAREGEYTHLYLFPALQKSQRTARFDGKEEWLRPFELHLEELLDRLAQLDRKVTVQIPPFHKAPDAA